MRVRFGVLGCASIARKYAIGSIQRTASLVALASRGQKGKEWAQEYGCDHESYDSLLQRNDIDAVYIPLPVGLHKEWVEKAARAGKHVLCEKALAGSYEEVKSMVKTCREHGVLLVENYVVDHHPQHEKVVSVTRNGDIGETRHFSSFYCYSPFAGDNIRYKSELGGGALNDAGGYLVFMARKMLSGEPRAATCTLFSGDAHVDTEGSFLMEFDRGRTATGFFGFNHVYQSTYSVIGTKGKIHVGRAYGIPPEVRPHITVSTQGNEAVIDAESANQFDLAFRNFIEKIGKPLEYNGLVSQARVMECLRVSAREGRRVLLKEVE
ncbi:MAG: oxidoreductase [Parcubacteria group bacterium Gr01-1014_38]|nr:MAG: oxidoreductase [Parcubacteria group bacterium Gr01-1014_38]